MRLATPSPRVTMEVGLTRVTPRLRGIFPPEEAARRRAAANVVADMLTARLDRIHENVQRELADHYFHGSP